jgi:transcriptional regulator with XRE-family HTH domain
MMESISIMEEEALALDRHIAERVRALRAERGLSLDALAVRSGVSRSMISLIERGETSPTAALLARLAAGLGVVLSALFEFSGGTAAPAGAPLARRENQPPWRDPDSGYQRRNVSPAGMPQPMQIVEVHFPAGARVAFDNALHEARVYQQVWLLAGAIDITLGGERHHLREGDCLAMQLDQPTMFHNPTRKVARYAVVTATDPAARR